MFIGESPVSQIDKTKHMKNKTLLIISVLLVLLFTYTAFSKWMDMTGFTRDMHNQPFPRWMGDGLVLGLPVLEMGIAVLLLFEPTRLTGLRVAWVLMGLFTLYTLLVLAHVFNRIPCSCGGVIKLLSWKQHLVFNLFFWGITWVGVRIEKKKVCGRLPVVCG